MNEIVCQPESLFTELQKNWYVEVTTDVKIWIERLYRTLEDEVDFWEFWLQLSTGPTRGYWIRVEET